MIYNPSKLESNCGFCSISRGLHRRNVIMDADQLYMGMLNKLHIPHDGVRDPISRTLLFPAPDRDAAKRRVGPRHQILIDMKIDESEYYITAAASYSSLPYRRGSPQLLQAFLEARKEGADWDDFAEQRADVITEDAERSRRAIKVPDHSTLKRAIMRDLVGDSIIGSSKAEHFMNVNIDGNGRVEAYDAQIGHTISSIPQRLGTIDLHLKLT